MSWIPSNSIGEGDDDSSATAGGNQQRSLMHARIVEYLKDIPRELQATFDDIEKELDIDLRRNPLVLDMMKNNKHVEVVLRDDDTYLFKYRSKYEIHNKADLLRELNRINVGISTKDLTEPALYDGIHDDIEDMMIGGEVIAHPSKEHGTVLFPRGQPFLTRLSGTVTAAVGREVVSTSADLTKEIRRGDAINIGLDQWFRVSSAPPLGPILQRQRPPLSVTSDRDMSSKNEYGLDFNQDRLPLDSDCDVVDSALNQCVVNMDGSINDNGASSDMYEGPVHRHGASNDLRALWTTSSDAVNKFVDKGDTTNFSAIRLRQELTRLKLISDARITTSHHIARERARSKGGQGKKRKRRVSDTGNTFNQHLRGSSLEKLKSDAAKELDL